MTFSGFNAEFARGLITGLIVCLVCSPIILYFIVRLAGAAWFNAKREYENRKVRSLVREK